MKNRKGFTLVELLAVIVILAIIMIIAIPAVLQTMQSARRKAFEEYIQKVYTTGERRYIEDTSFNNIPNVGQGYILYSIKDDLGMSNTGDFNGFFIIYKNNEKAKTEYWVFLYDKEFGFYEEVYDTTEQKDLNEIMKNKIVTVQELKNSLGYSGDLSSVNKAVLKGTIKARFDGCGSWGSNFKILDPSNETNPIENICS